MDAPMTPFIKFFLALLACVFLVWFFGCGGGTVIEPNGFLYIANSFRPGSVSGFSVTEGALGHLTNSPYITGGNAPYSLAVVSNKFVYGGVPATSKGGVITRLLGRTLSGSVTGGIVMMSITQQSQSEEQLNLPPNTPQMFATGGDYDPVVVTPGGGFLYAADLTTNHVAAFSIDSSKGTLTAVGPQGPPVGMAVGPDPFNVTIDPQGKFLFVANCDFTSPSNRGSVSVFAINSDGTLTAAPGSPFLIGPDASPGASHPVGLAVSPDNAFLFIASLDDKVYVESISGTGVLTDAIPGTPSVSVPAGSTPVSVAVSIDGGNTVYTGNAGTQNVSFLLNCVQPLATRPSPCSGVPGPLAFQNNISVGGTVGILLADPTSIPASTNVSAIAVGHFLYATDYDHGVVVSFVVTSTTACSGYPNESVTTTCTPIPGTLTQNGVTSNSGGTSPYGMAMAH